MIVRSLTVDGDDQLEADLLQRDVALARERQRQTQVGAVLGDDQLLGERVVEDAAGSRSVEQLAAEAVEHLGTDDLMVEERRAQHRDRREGRVHELQVLLLHAAPAVEVVADAGGEQPVDDTASVRYP